MDTYFFIHPCDDTSSARDQQVPCSNELATKMGLSFWINNSTVRLLPFLWRAVRFDFNSRAEIETTDIKYHR